MTSAVTEQTVRPKVLVVDDEALHIQNIYELLKDDYEVYMATDGRTALEVTRDLQPDLVLLDVVMPSMDGFSVCRELKAETHTSDIPVIFLTGKNTPEEETEGLDAGAVDFVSKPLNPQVVRARVKTHVMLKTQADRMRMMALTDPLTGVSNRRAFDERLDHEWKVCRRNARSLAVLIIDVDHFKAFNDHYGHQAGDKTLCQVALVLRESLRRPSDFLGRYGGEEFACLVPEASRSAAHRVGEYLRDRIVLAHLPHQASPTAPFVTVSIGIAAQIPSPRASVDGLVALADRNLYRAKGAGRNRVCGDGDP